MSEDLLHQVNELSIPEFLDRLKGREVTLLLKHDQTITGTLSEKFDYASMSTKLVLVETLRGQEFFDAVIPKDAIAGFILRKAGR